MRRTNVTRNDSTRLKKFRQLLASQRALSRVARKVGVTRTHVYYVAKGVRRSEAVEAELLREIERIENESAA